MANTSTIHIKTDFDCIVYDYGQKLGATKADTYFNIELRKGEHELTFVLKDNEGISKVINYDVKESDCDHKLFIDFTDTICDALDSCIDDFYAGRLYVLPKDWKTLQTSFKGESAKLLYKLGYIYENEVYVYSLDKLGKIVGDDLKMKPDKRKALACYVEAADRGYAEAQYDLGCLYEGLPRDRWGMLSLVKTDFKEAIKWYTKAAEQGHFEAQYRLGICYKRGKGCITNDYTKAVEWFAKAAEQGHSFALNELGVCYEKGRGINTDERKAVQCYTQSHSMCASINLAYCFFYGIGVEKNYDRVDEIAYCYVDGHDPSSGSVYEDDDKYWRGNPVEWYKKAAKGGDVEAQYRLGKLYEEFRHDDIDGQDIESEHIPDDISKAVIWYTKAAKQGLAKAQFALGKCYDEGKGVEEDYQKAINWYNKAAKQGNVNAQKNLIDCYYKLGECYEFGYGFEKNPDLAEKWYSKAAEEGHKDAQNAVLRLLLSKTDSIAATMCTSMFFPNTTKNSKPQAKPIKYLFFDTETTGIPKDYDAPTSDSRNWPRLVQLSWITTDEDCNVLSKNDHIIYPDRFTIPANAARVHGITTKIAKEKGEPLNEVIEKFHKDYDAAYIIVGHNIDFDKKIISAELIRLAEMDFILFNTKLTLCTMETSTDYCKIPGYHGYKYPKLQELHKKLFGYEFEDAHNSMSDVTATLKCFKEMRKRGLI